MDAPRPASAEAAYFTHLSEGRLMLQRSRETGEIFFYPRMVAPGSGGTDLEWVPASGNGTVYATTVMHVRSPEAPYNVCLVELDEGCRMMSRVEGVPPDQVRVGLRVRATITQPEGERPMVIFHPMQGEASS